MSEDALETLTVLATGLHTLVVDRGRPRTRSLGVSVGGAADRRALALGNALLGNEEDAAALEINFIGPTLLSSGPIAAVVFGAPSLVMTQRRNLTAETTFTLEAGETLRILVKNEGMRAYLCVQGGFQLPAILGSRSALGPVTVGAQLPCLRSATAARFLRHQFVDEDAPELLRTIEGPQADWFPRDPFYQTPFYIAPESNRMGLRLKASRPLVLATTSELISEPVCPGTVQVARGGQCIVLGVDAQTIGGYPKIAQVIAADLDKLGQLRPGSVVRFQRVTVSEAETLYQERQAELHEWLLRSRTAAGTD